MILQIRKAVTMRARHDTHCFVAPVVHAHCCLSQWKEYFNTQSNLFSLLEFLIISY